MNEFLNFLPYFLLLFVRLTSFFVVAPLFSMRGVPNQFKIGLAFFITLIVSSTMPMDELIQLDFTYILLILKEFIIGIALGFVAAMILYTVQIAGSFIDFQMGFAIANVVDPQTGTQVPIIGQFKYMLALLFLLTTDGHHLMINGVMQSVKLLPVGTLQWTTNMGSVSQFIVLLFIEVFIIALQIAIPIVGALLLVDVALGFMAKTVPQLNIFVIGFPLKIFLGFVLLLLTMPVFFYLLSNLFEKLLTSMSELVKLLGGP